MSNYLFLIFLFIYIFIAGRHYSLLLLTFRFLLLCLMYCSIIILPSILMIPCCIHKSDLWLARGHLIETSSYFLYYKSLASFSFPYDSLNLDLAEWIFSFHTFVLQIAFCHWNYLALILFRLHILHAGKCVIEVGVFYVCLADRRSYGWFIF